MATIVTARTAFICVDLVFTPGIIFQQQGHFYSSPLKTLSCAFGFQVLSLFSIYFSLLPLLFSGLQLFMHNRDNSIEKALFLCIHLRTSLCSVILMRITTRVLNILMLPIFRHSEFQFYHYSVPYSNRGFPYSFPQPASIRLHYLIYFLLPLRNTVLLEIHITLQYLLIIHSSHLIGMSLLFIRPPFVIRMVIKIHFVTFFKTPLGVTF